MTINQKSLNHFSFRIMKRTKKDYDLVNLSIQNDEIESNSCKVYNDDNTSYLLSEFINKYDQIL